jgi:hypothetical protein
MPSCGVWSLATECGEVREKYLPNLPVGWLLVSRGAWNELRRRTASRCTKQSEGRLGRLFLPSAHHVRSSGERFGRVTLYRQLIYRLEKGDPPWTSL